MNAQRTPKRTLERTLERTSRSARRSAASTPANLEDALAALHALVRQGVEYPDAHCNVIARFRLKRHEADEIADRYLLPEAGRAMQTPLGSATTDIEQSTDQPTGRRFGHVGVLRINRKQMHRWQVTSDNVRMHEAIVNAPGALLVLDSRPYVEALCEFGIFYTLSPLWLAPNDTPRNTAS
jgi:hypothetical protein